MILKSCPFCGGTAEFERIGNGRQSCIVECGDCGATVEANEVGEHCGSKWNGREPTEGEKKLEEIRQLLLDGHDARDFLQDVAELLEVEVTFPD